MSDPLAPFRPSAVFVRAGTVLPIGKPCVTVTSATGLPSTTADGTVIRLKADGGVVELDDFRGVEIFPPPPQSSASTPTYVWEWNEDDGESHLDGLKVSRVRVEYSASGGPGGEEVVVKASWVQREFETLWTELWVVLPKGDGRRVRGGREWEWRGRRGWVVPVAEV